MRIGECKKNKQKKKFKIPTIVWEMNLGAITYHSMKASFNATANKRLTKLWASLRRALQTNLGVTKTKLLILSQTIATWNPLSIVTISSKNHYYAILSVCGTVITQLGIWGNGNKGKCVTKVKDE